MQSEEYEQTQHQKQIINEEALASDNNKPTFRFLLKDNEIEKITYNREQNVGSFRATPSQAIH